MIKKAILVAITVAAFGAIITFSTITTMADSDTNSDTNVNAAVNGADASGSNAQPESSIKNWHEVN